MEAVKHNISRDEKNFSVDEKKIWQNCLNKLQNDIPEKDFMIYISPLHAVISVNMIDLLAPNNEILNRVNSNYLANIAQAVRLNWPYENLPPIALRVGSKLEFATKLPIEKKSAPNFHSNLNKTFTFNSFVLGKSNQIARAAAAQVAENPSGNTYNPLFIHGGVGLGKTHLMHAIGNLIHHRDPHAKVLYIHSEGFVSGMVKALQCNKMDQFKNLYRELDCLLIDDIQFFAGKERSQEEFFHTLNALLDGQRQVVITCDKYPKEMTGLEERLKSRFGWGLTVSVEPPDLETRVAILQSKAEQSHIHVPQDICFFIAQRIQSNVRELEGALKRVIANAHFTGEIITIEFAKEALKDLLAVQAKMVSIDNIIKTVAEYYKMKSADLLSKKRSRFIARSRQMAMTLAKELTNHSLPEIGDAFGGRDHTTVLHANRTIRLLIEKEVTLKEDFTNLLRILST